MDVVWKNLVYSVRMLLKRPSLTAIAIIAIGLGIGANTAIFSVVNTVLLQPLPYEQPEQLLTLATEQRNQALDGRELDCVARWLTSTVVPAVRKEAAGGERY